MAATTNTIQTPAKSNIQPNSNKVKHAIVNQFKGYRAKEDLTSLAPGYLVQGSQNVITLASGQVAIRGGYSLDGQSAGTAVGGITSAFDWLMHTGTEQHLRVDSANGKLQFRYVASAGQSWGSTNFTAGQVYWIDLVTGLTSTQTTINFAVWWDTTNLQQKLLYVYGDSNIFEWSGGVATFASATSNTITLQGTSTWAQLGFLNTGTRTITIYDSGGTARNFTYTGGEGSATITGVSPDPTTFTFNVGAVIFQTVRTNANSASTGLPSAFKNSLIGVVKNQVYIGSLVDNSVYISKNNSFTDFSFTAAARVVGEGALVTLDATPIGFVEQENTMYITAGRDWWYNISFQLDSSNTKEALNITPLKISPGQAAVSQAAIFKVKNSVMFITNEPAIDDLGRVSDNLAYPETVTITDSIRNDFLGYDLTNASGIYYRYFLLVAVPKEGKVIAYNLSKEWWEAPQVLPVSRFSIIGGKLYGHSSTAPETYRLFLLDPRTSSVPFNDNSNPINAIAAFSYMNEGERSVKKNFTEIYVEGGIQPNTTLQLGVKYDFGGATTTQTYNIKGGDNSFLVYTITDGSIGKNPLGSNPIGSITDSPTDTPKFRHIFTTAPIDFFEWQPVFQTNNADYYWQILGFGADVKISQSQSNEIKS